MAVEPLSKTVMYAQEKGMSSFALGDNALNAKDKRLKEALASANSHEYLHHHSSGNLKNKASQEKLKAKAGVGESFTDLREVEDGRHRGLEEGLVLSSFTVPKAAAPLNVDSIANGAPAKLTIATKPQVVNNVSRKYANESPRNVDHLATMSVTSEFR